LTSSRKTAKRQSISGVCPKEVWRERKGTYWTFREGNQRIQEKRTKKRTKGCRECKKSINSSYTKPSEWVKFLWGSQWKESWAGRDQKGLSSSLASSEGSPPLPYPRTNPSKGFVPSETRVGGRGVG